MFTITSIHDADNELARVRKVLDKYPHPKHPTSTLYELHQEMGGNGGRYGCEVYWFYADMTSRLELRRDGQMMGVGGGGPSYVAAQLRHVLAELGDADGVYDTGFTEGAYGLWLRFTRIGDVLMVERACLKGGQVVPHEEDIPVESGGAAFGPPRLSVPWDEFVTGAENYLHWHITEHVFEAPWLFHSPLIRQWRREAGLHTACPDHPETATADE